MSDTMNSELTQHWVEVTDAGGRTRLEARWIGSSPLPNPVTSAA